MLKKFFRVEISVIVTRLATGVPCRYRLSSLIFILCTEIFYNKHKLHHANYDTVAYSLIRRAGNGGAPQTEATSPTMMYA